MLEIAPHLFAEKLLLLGSGAARRMVGEIDRLHQLHEEQKERNTPKITEKPSLPLKNVSIEGKGS